MSQVTNNIARYIKSKGIQISKISEVTNLEYSRLYDSLGSSGRGRDLRDDEMIKVCTFLGKNPMDFADAEEPAEVE